MKPSSVSAARALYLEQKKREQRSIRLLRCGLIGFLLLLWEFSVRRGWLDPFLTSSPSRIVALVVRLVQDGSLWPHLGWTLGETLLGFGLGSIFGLLIAAGLWWSPFWAKILEPYLVVLNSLPKVALGPLFIIWLGTGLQAITAVALAIALVTAILQIYTGFQETDPNYLKLAASFGANRRQIFTSIVFPAALPAVMSALKVSIGLSMVGVIMGEFLVAKQGLGYLIIYGGQVFNLNLVMSSTVILLAAATLLYLLIDLLEKRLISWK